jgi:fibro-slime domain-containing protein
MHAPAWRLALTTTALFLGCSAQGGDDDKEDTLGSGGTVPINTGGSGNRPGSGGTGTGGTTTIPSAGGAGGTINPGAGGSGGLQGGPMCEGVGSKLKGLIRDFTATTNPDFEPQLGSKGVSAVNKDDRGIVAQTIDPTTMKPTYAGGPSGTATTYGPSSFASWFRDTPGVNMSLEYAIEFTGPDANGVYTYDRTGSRPFLPIDDGPNCPTTPQDPCLMGNTSLRGNDYPHNYSMTFELHTNFVYRPGMVFTFSGDDDVFVYINNALVIDLGGIHMAETASINLDTLGLAAGSTYRLDFFWAERHLTLSNFRIDTSLEFIDCGIDPVR